MPQQQDRYDWTEYKDFTGGLWQRTDRECPPNGLLALNDAYPLPTGGLRAWGAWQAVDMTGIPNNAYIFGIFHIPGPDSGSYAVGGLYLHCLQVNQGGAGIHQFQLYKYSPGKITSGAVAAGGWVLLKTVGALTDFLPAQHMQSFRFSTGSGFLFRNFYNVAFTSTAASGVFKTDGTTITTANVQAYFADLCDVVIGHQARLLTVSIENFIENVLRYTSVASVTAPSTAQFIIPSGEISAPITWAAVIEPSDLMVHKHEVGIFNLQGDITQPIVRQMNWSHSIARTYPVQIDEGLCMSVGNDSVYVWTGSQLHDIAYQLLANPTQADAHGEIAGVFQGGEPNFNIPGNTLEMHGKMGASDDFLFAGQNYLMDLRTKAWFQVTSPSASTFGTEKYFAIDRFNHLVFHTRSLSMQAGRTLVYWEDIREDHLHRTNSYTFTLPLIHRDHAFVQLRAIEFYVHTFGAGSAIQVTIDAVALDGTVKTTTLASSTLPATANNYQVRFDLPGDASHSYKIDVTMSANAGVEAPMVEKILVGTASSIALKQI